jgi:hypothetical protein
MAAVIGLRGGAWTSGDRAQNDDRALAGAGVVMAAGKVSVTK